MLAASKPRDYRRLFAAWPASRAVGFLSTVVAFLAGVRYWQAGFPVGLSPAGLLGVAIVLLFSASLRCLWKPSSAWMHTAIALAGVATFLIGFLPTELTPYAGPLGWCSVLTVAAAALIGVTARIPGSAIYLSMFWMLSLVTAAVFLSLGYRVAPSYTLAFEDSEPEAMLYGFGFFIKDDALGSALRPNGLGRTFYSHNRRGYFDSLDSPTRLPARSNFLFCTPGTEIILTASDPHEDVARFLVLRWPDDGFSRLNLSEDFTFRQGEPITLSLKLRSSRPLEMRLGLCAGTDKRDVAQKTVSVGSDWGDFKLETTPDKDLPGGNPFLEPIHLKPQDWFEMKEVQLICRDKYERSKSFPYYVDYTINEHGFRDLPRSVLRPPGAIRIACVGDSFAFGQGVRDQDVVNRQMEAILNRRLPTEVLNFAAPGYCTKQHRILIERDVLRFDPQILLLLMVDNDNICDDELPPDIATLQKDRAVDGEETKRVSDYLMSQNDYGSCLNYISAIAAECRKRGVKLGIVDFCTGGKSRISKYVLPGCEKMGVKTLSVGEEFVNKYEASDLLVSKVDLHPNEIAHRTVGQALVKWLDSLGWIADAEKQIHR